KSKLWWNLTILDPLRRAAAKAQKIMKKERSQKSMKAYHSARNLYIRAIEKEKTISWQLYLSTLKVDTLFQAKKYASGP
ncbi:hypothetical protein CROQUDRAFT_44104, partial [Cronartium quercuum f. sp. fusiforme G11]